MAYYRVNSTDPEYNDFLALQADGKADEVNRRYLDGGVIESVFQTRARNPAIKVGAGFFANALRDYDEWKVKWWRECVQNAIDAGARDVYLDATQNDDGTWTVSCTDDGSGMDEETMLTKFLVLGETGKAAREGMIGGFGKAKELLILPWIGWSIQSRDLFVVGAGIDYEIDRNREHIRGTQLSVIMPADNYTDDASAMEFLQRCEISGVRFYINGKRFTEKLRRGREVGEFSFGPYFHNKSKNYGRAYVRANGMFMFAAGYLDYGLGTVIVELTGDTTELLTANRDGFRSYKSRLEIDHFLNRIATERERALQARSTRVTKVWKGEAGQITTEQGMTDVLDAMGPTPQVGPKEALEFSDDAKVDIAEVLEDVARYAKHTEGVNLGPATGDIAVEVMRQPIKGQTDTEAMAQQLVWTPDFMIHNELDHFSVPRKFTPEHMSPKVEALAKVWAEACRWVFIQLGKKARYGVGFVFSEHALAMHYTHGDDGSEWLLLNPFVDIYERGAIWSKSRRDHMKKLYISAIHEVTHMADGYSAHDASFIALLERNMATAIDGFSTLLRIARTIKIRATEREEREEREPEDEPTVDVRVEINRAGDVSVYPLEHHSDELKREFPDIWVYPGDRYLLPYVAGEIILEEVKRAGLHEQLTEQADVVAPIHEAFAREIFTTMNHTPYFTQPVNVKMHFNYKDDVYCVRIDPAYHDDFYTSLVAQVAYNKWGADLWDDYSCFHEHEGDLLAVDNTTLEKIFHAVKAKGQVKFTIPGMDFMEMLYSVYWQ